MSAVGNPPPATRVDLERGPWTGTETELREFAAYAFETAQPKQLNASPLIRGASIAELTQDQHAIFKAAGYPLVIVPGKGEFYIPPQSRGDAEKFLTAHLEPPLPSARLKELTKSRPSTRIAGAVHGLRPAMLLSLSANHFRRLNPFQLDPSMPWMARAQGLAQGSATLLREAGYCSMTAAEAKLLYMPEGVAESADSLIHLDPNEVVWVEPRTDPLFVVSHTFEPLQLPPLKVLPDGNIVQAEDYKSAAKIWRGLQRIQLESTYSNIPNTPDMVKDAGLPVAVAETLRTGGYNLRRAGDVLSEFLVEERGPLSRLDPNDMVWVEPYRKPGLPK